MMAGADFRLDRAGIGEILRSADMANAIAEATDAIGDELRARGVDDVYVDAYVSDRAAAIVTIPHSASAELVDGRLVDAATAAGLDVRPSRA